MMSIEEIRGRWNAVSNELLRIHEEHGEPTIKEGKACFIKKVEACIEALGVLERAAVYHSDNSKLADCMAYIIGKDKIDCQRVVNEMLFEHAKQDLFG